MMEQPSNGFYRTTDFREAIYLRKSGIIYVSTSWPTPQQAVFCFKKPSDEVLSAWQRGDDDGVRATLDAADFFRDELRRRDR
jgi:hypothetical protein